MKKLLILMCVLALSFHSLFAQSGNALVLDGVNQYMKIPNHADFNITTSESFTVSFWINMAVFNTTNMRFVAKRAQTTTLADKSGWELWGGNSATNYCAVNTPNAAGNHNNSVSVWTNDATAALNTWSHFALVIDRASGKMYEYLNGVEKATSGTKDISTWACNNENDVIVGAGISGTYPTQTIIQYFNGKIDNLRIYKRALSATELQEDMTSVVTASTTGLVAAYNFENINGTTVEDITGNHPGTLINFPVQGPVMVAGASVAQDANFTGRGSKNEVILKAAFTTTGTIAASINNIKLTLNGTTQLSDVENIKVYNTASSTAFDPRNPSGVLLGTASVASGEITVSTNGNLVSGVNNLWITCDVANNATEGAKIDATLISMTTANETYTFTAGNPTGSREILLTRTLVFAPGDYGSTNYRIPAILTLADGSLLTLTDKRKNNSADLPQDIDIVSRKSTDGGKTWSAPVTVALGTGYGKGFGDACIMQTKTGKIVALFVGGNQFQASTSSNPIRSYMSTSTDNGLTWSTPKDLTDDIYGDKCTDPVRKTWQGMFFGSGRGLTMRDGRIMAVMTVKPSSGSYKNYTIFSDDEGTTWQYSNLAIDGGDEAKVVELNDGTILMSSRVSGNRLWAKSTDKGVNWGAKNSWSEIWGNACDADIVRYTSTLDGYDKNRLLHTLPNASNRTKVNMWISYDEGTTWPVKRTLCEGTSAYSSITILPDGTIGVYLEEDESVPYRMYFLNFSLNWLTKGSDNYVSPGTPVVSQPVSSLAAGRYAPPQTVNLTTTTSGASIYYTLDGSNPNTNSTLYSQAINLTESCTLKAIAVKDGMANSAILSVSYTIGYVVPGQNRSVGADRYVTSASTTGGASNISYSAASVPASHYIYHSANNVTASRGEVFTLNLTALPGQTDGLQWCQTIILVDWNQDFDFADNGERIVILGSREKDNSATVMNIAQEITVPATALLGKTRIRVVYSDAWRPTAYADLGEDLVDKGRMYDFDLIVDQQSGVDSNNHKNISISNPVKDQLIVQLPAEKMEVSLSDLNGKIIFKTKTSNALFNYPVKGLAPQVYILRLTDEQGNNSSYKLIKQ